MAPEWSDPFRGRFDQGWDVLREEIFARQKRLGVIPADAELTERHESLPAWDSLPEQRQRIASRLMEVYARVSGPHRP
ncbi:Arylsulfatase [Mycobacterium marinum]|nr:Arylsulfatase [Mycobacterium marinum]